MPDDFYCLYRCPGCGDAAVDTGEGEEVEFLDSREESGLGHDVMFTWQSCGESWNQAELDE